MRKVYTLCTNVIFTTPDLTFQMYVSISIRGKDVSIPGKDVSPEMPINRGMAVKGEGGERGERVLSFHISVSRLTLGLTEPYKPA